MYPSVETLNPIGFSFRRCIRTRMDFLPLTLSRAALSSRCRSDFRHQALELLRRELDFSVGLYLELSPECSLDDAGQLCVHSSTVDALRVGWSQFIAEVEALCFRSLKQAGVTTDAEAFLRNRAGRASWTELVATPLGASSMLVAHLVVQDRVVAAMLLGRTEGHAFSVHERRWLAALVPILSVCEAIHLGKSPQETSRRSARGRCLDQRLTKRQRQVVEHVAQGRTNKEVGQALGISEHTVRNLLVDARARLNAHNRAELVRLSMMR